METTRIAWLGKVFQVSADPPCEKWTSPAARAN